MTTNQSHPAFFEHSARTRLQVIETQQQRQSGVYWQRVGNVAAPQEEHVQFVDPEAEIAFGD